MKINLIENVLGKPLRGSSNTLTLRPQNRGSLLYIPEQEPQQGKGRISPNPATAQPMRNHHTQPMRSFCHPEFFKTDPPKFFLSSIKLALFSRHAYGYS